MTTPLSANAFTKDSVHVSKYHFLYIMILYFCVS